MPFTFKLEPISASLGGFDEYFEKRDCSAFAKNCKDSKFIALLHFQEEEEDLRVKEDLRGLVKEGIWGRQGRAEWRKPQHFLCALLHPSWLWDKKSLDCNLVLHTS